MAIVTSPSAPGVHRPGIDPKAPTVLVVDDNSDKRLALKSILLPLGYRIVEADSGVAALRCLMVDDFAVILLDVRMPDMDGFETASRIRQRVQSEMTPIIFITANRSDELAGSDRYAQGAVDFIYAPVAPTELRAKVSVFANLYTRAELLAAQARQVQSSVDQLRLLMESAPIGIFQTDVDNRYVYTNPRWSAITGIPPEESAGRLWHTIIGAEQHEALSADLDDGASTPREFWCRFDMAMPSGKPRIVQLTSRPLPDDDGGHIGWVGTIADVTAEAGAEAALEAAWDSALANSRMQKDFAASASHELRTPTAAILGFVEEVLENDALSEEDRGFLEIVYRNAQRLNQLIDDLLILGQADIGTSEMHLVPTRMVTLVERVMSNFSGTAQRAGISLVASDATDHPTVMADPQRLEQVLTNLLSNALKFTPEGGTVTVTVRAVGDTVQIDVADTGHGIDPADIDRIFDRFFRAKTSGDSVKGSGLGLAIAKGMIEAQHGQLHVTSTPGQGATFTITVPVAHGAEIDLP